ncbi:MAG: hypothetical protein MJZ36_08305 [Bacteroidaceae bacterium]|nr:hypothetical protein [Bacteroidaceae bacterium]
MAFFKYNKELISMFEDTMDHFRSGNGLLSLEECEECIGLDPDTVDGINLPEKMGECKITVTRNDSFGAAMAKGEGCLVLNFMSAWVPGGGTKKEKGKRHYTISDTFLVGEATALAMRTNVKR